MELSKEDQPSLSDVRDLALLRAAQDGLPLVPRPYAELAERLGMTEGEVLARLWLLRERGFIKRFGVVVRHHELGYRSNAMVVWDVPDALVAEVGRELGGVPYVTLCYRRPRRLPVWPYNLFTMIHGRDRTQVLARIAELVELSDLDGVRYQILFSRRRFKQRGARYGAAPDPGSDARPDLGREAGA